MNDYGNLIAGKTFKVKKGEELYILHGKVYPVSSSVKFLRIAIVIIILLLIGMYLIKWR